MTGSGAVQKSADAYRTISEVADELKLPQHVLRFWETRFAQVKPLKRAGGRRFYRPEDVDLLRAVKTLLYGDGYTIKGVQRILREHGPRAVAALAATSVRDRGPRPRVSPATESPASTATSPAFPPAEAIPVGGGSTGQPPPDRAPVGDAEGVGTAAARLRAALSEIEDCTHLLRKARGPAA